MTVVASVYYANLIMQYAAIYTIATVRVSVYE